MTTLRITDTSPRADIEAAIAALRARAKRLSRHDPRRDEIDAECDVLVEQWMVAEA